MPFGLTNAPATFMHLMQQTLRRFLDDFVIVFIDDILIYSKTLEDHAQHLRQVLQVLQEKQLYAKLSKCDFFKHEMGFLGHVINENGIKMESSKVNAVTNWPVPTNVHELRSFLGLARDKQTHYANQHRRDVVFKEGEMVWLSTQHLNLPDGITRKLSSRYTGPFQILEVISPVNYKLAIPEEWAKKRMHPVF